MNPEKAKIIEISLRPESISRFKKEKYLEALSEDQFRDEVARPLFLHRGLTDGRDFCGRDEEGKACIFTDEDKLGMRLLYVVQTKKGNLNLAKKASDSLIEAKTQLQTALQTKVTFTATRERIYPSVAILCASGKINQSARNYIAGEINDPRLRFMDSDDLIPEIDKSYPELWFGIDADKFPYLRSLVAKLSSSDPMFSDILSSDTLSPITDESFVQLHLIRITLQLKRQHGQTFRFPKFEQIMIPQLLETKEKLFLIIGEAGSGKSTALNRLAFIIATRGLKEAKEIQIPVLLRSKNIMRESKEIGELLGLETAKLSLSGNPCFSSKELNAGNIVVLIDGLDEVSGNLQRVDILKRIEKFHTLYPLCKIILTSRDYSFLKELEELAPYETYRITPIDWKQAEQIVRRVRHGDTALPEGAIKEMLRRIQDVHGVELNPLLITVFAATSDYSRRDIPANITELFKKYTEMMLGRWDASKGLAQQFHAPLKDFLLCQLAFGMHKRKLTSIPINECTCILETELHARGKEEADIDLLVDEMINRSGLFRIVDEDVEFRHLLLQEFFAGRGIPSTDFLRSVVTEEWWRRAIVFYFGEHPGEHDTLKMVISTIGTRAEEEIFQATVTLGSALQACYLIKIDPKAEILWWVLTTLVQTKKYFAVTDSKSRFPLTGFLFYYLFGRDAVACDIIGRKADEFTKEYESSSALPGDKDLFRFWTITGLLECGNLGQAERLFKEFHPDDRRLLLALHLGCFLIENLRVSTKEEKKIAKRICDRIAPLVQDLRLQVINEFKTELIEVRKKKIEPLQISHASPQNNQNQSDE